MKWLRSISIWSGICSALHVWGYHFSWWKIYVCERMRKYIVCVSMDSHFIFKKRFVALEFKFKTSISWIIAQWTAIWMHLSVWYILKLLMVLMLNVDYLFQGKVESKVTTALSNSKRLGTNSITWRTFFNCMEIFVQTIEIRFSIT